MDDQALVIQGKRGFLYEDSLRSPSGLELWTKDPAKAKQYGSTEAAAGDFNVLSARGFECKLVKGCSVGVSA